MKIYVVCCMDENEHTNILGAGQNISSALKIAKGDMCELVKDWFEDSDEDTELAECLKRIENIRTIDDSTFGWFDSNFGHWYSFDEMELE